MRVSRTPSLKAYKKVGLRRCGVVSQVDEEIEEWGLREHLRLAPGSDVEEREA